MKKSFVGKRFSLEQYSNRVRVTFRFDGLPLQLILIGLIIILMAGIGIIDYSLGSGLDFYILYLVPIAIATWFLNVNYGFMASVVSMAIVICLSLLSRTPSSPVFPLVWSLFSILVVYTLFTVLLDRYREKTHNLECSSTTDSLTEASLSKHFHDVACAELEMARRYDRPLTFVYLDVDDFKQINDKFGHSTGDDVLRRVAAEIKENLREGDIVGRMGGDEFAMLLPETDPEVGNMVVVRLLDRLEKHFAKEIYKVTFSVGITTFYKHPSDVDELIAKTDQLMYEAKHNGKNKIVKNIN
jgi:diguanylate cyclase (GGDEF)-like protein